MRAHPLHIVVIGRPGAGKGTQAAKLAAELGLEHVSTGDLLREEVAAGGPNAEIVASYLGAGALVPDAIVDAIVARRITAAEHGTVLDGYPRSMLQAQLLDRLVDVAVVVDLDVPDHEVLARLARRGRADDDAATTLRRLRVYEVATRPVLDRYAASGRLVRVDGVGPIDDVTQRLRRAVDEALAAAAG